MKLALGWTGSRPRRGRTRPGGMNLAREGGHVAADARGNIYISDKQWGLTILRYHGPGKVTRA